MNKRDQKSKFQINGKTEEEITFNQIKEKSLLVARCLYKYGIRKYDKVAIVCDNRFDFIAVAYGIIYVGAMPALINISYKECECFLRPIKL